MRWTFGKSRDCNVIDLPIPKKRILRDMKRGDCVAFRVHKPTAWQMIGALTRDLDGRWSISGGWFVPAQGEPVQILIVRCEKENTVPRQKRGRKRKTVT